MRTSLRICSFTLMALLSVVARAADVYQIEVVVFSRPAGASEEQSATSEGLAYPLRLAPLQDASADATSVGAFQLLPSSARLLNNEEAALSRRGFPILFHGAWRQPVENATRATSAAIAGGRGAGTHRELSGYVTLSAENYLHIDVNLWFAQFASGADHAAENIPLPLPSGTVPDPDATPTPIAKLLVLRQQRKIRSGELHYFDQPRFSVLLLVKPID